MAKKILVVDDDLSMTHMVETRLKAEGYEVIALNFPKNAIKLIKNERPDLVLLDIIMPYMDGYKLCEEIKSSFGNKIPVIIYTAKSYEKELIAEAHKAFGADDFLIKPFQPEELLAKIEKLIPKEDTPSSEGP